MVAKICINDTLVKVTDILNLNVGDKIEFFDPVEKEFLTGKLKAFGNCLCYFLLILRN